MRFVLIPAGEFLMGGDETPDEVSRNASTEEVDSVASNYADEHPQRKVRISKSFYLGVYEVTQSEWKAVTGTNPSSFSDSGGWRDKVAGVDTSDFPAETITWYDAIEFCNRLSRQEGLGPYYTMNQVTREEGRITDAKVTIAGGSGYRLPTEAEWEYACRAGTSTAFPFGDTCRTDQARVHTPYPEPPKHEGEWIVTVPTTTVGSFQPNPFGLYDMNGNVSEWCYDVYAPSAYAMRGELTVDPVVSSRMMPPNDLQDSTQSNDDPFQSFQDSLTGNERVIRGGDSSDYGASARCAARICGDPAAGSNIGLRLARSP